MENQDVGNLIRRKNIRTYTELLAFSEERRAEGLTDLAKYMFDHSKVFVLGVIDTAWGMAEAPAQIVKQRKDRLDILKDFKDHKPCVCGGGEWLIAANQLLGFNNINRNEFKSAFRTNLELGRAKYRNVMIIGNRNCGKSFIIKPLSKIYGEDAFQNPARNKYGWVGAQKASIIMLQDFRWSSDLIEWSDFLRLLEEDEPVRLPAPRNLCKEDVLIDTQVAFFATGKTVIKFKGPYQSKDIEEE